jgi:hypothetical protein
MCKLKQIRFLQKEKNHLPPDAEIPATEMVLCKEFAGRTEAAYLPHIRCRGGSASAEETGGLVFFQGMTLVVLAYRAVLPADLLVLFGVFHNRFVAGAKHAD